MDKNPEKNMIMQSGRLGQRSPDVVPRTTLSRVIRLHVLNQGLLYNFYIRLMKNLKTMQLKKGTFLEDIFVVKLLPNLTIHLAAFSGSSLISRRKKRRAWERSCQSLIAISLTVQRMAADWAAANAILYHCNCTLSVNLV